VWRPFVPTQLIVASIPSDAPAVACGVADERRGPDGVGRDLIGNSKLGGDFWIARHYRLVVPYLFCHNIALSPAEYHIVDGQLTGVTYVCGCGCYLFV
jgi:hypothetical protein